jgi:DUF971 family protein
LRLKPPTGDRRGSARPRSVARGRGATPSADKSAAPQGVTIVGVETIGNDAARFVFSDGHDTGLYTWKLLRELAERTTGTTA